MASTTDYINLTLYQDESLDETVTFETSFQIEDKKLISRISKDYSATAFTGDDDAGTLVAYVVNNVGALYTNGAAHVLAISGGGGASGTATCKIDGGKIISVTITNVGSGYTSQPTVALPAGAGSGDSLASISLLVGASGYLTLNAIASQATTGDTFALSLNKTKTGALDDSFSGYWDLSSKDNSSGEVTRQVNGEVYLEKSVTKEGAFA
jgi:hypothetical protein